NRLYTSAPCQAPGRIDERKRYHSRDDEDRCRAEGQARCAGALHQAVEVVSRGGSHRRLCRTERVADRRDPGGDRGARRRRRIVPGASLAALRRAGAAAVTARRLEYAPRYFRRLEDIRERIDADNPAAAERLMAHI